MRRVTTGEGLRREQVAKLASVRRLGKREALKRLEMLDARR